MQKAIDHLESHVIVCGVGTTGTHVVRELVAAKTPFVMIENDDERISEIKERVDPDDQVLGPRFARRVAGQGNHTQEERPQDGDDRHRHHELHQCETAAPAPSTAVWEPETQATQHLW